MTYITRTSDYLKNRKRQVRLKQPEKYAVNPTQFLHVNTPEAAYILGLLWADGHLVRNGTGIVLVLTEDSLVEMGATFAKTGKWGVHRRKRVSKWQQSIVITTGNNRLWWHLHDHGYCAKSIGSADQILSTIPDHLKHYWFRGLIDGDGCFSVSGKTKKRFSLCSSYAQDWTYMEGLLKGLGIRYRIERCTRINAKTGNQNSYSKVHVEELKSVTALGDYVYQGRQTDGLGLTRKWETWKVIRDHFLDLPTKTSRYPYICVNRRKGNWRCDYRNAHVGWFKTEALAKEGQDRYATERGLPLLAARESGARHWRWT